MVGRRRPLERDRLIQSLYPSLIVDKVISIITINSSGSDICNNQNNLNVQFVFSTWIDGSLNHSLIPH